MESSVIKSWKRQSRCLDFQQTLEPSAHCGLSAGTFSAFVPNGHDLFSKGTRTLWWKLFGLSMHDLYDWQIHKIDDVTCAFYGIIGTSPHLDKIPEDHRRKLLSMLPETPSVELFADIVEHFEAKMQGRVQRKNNLVDINGYQLGIFRFGHTVYAVENLCPHANGPLGLGDIEEIDGRLCVICPWHNWRFELKTGRSWQPPRQATARVFPVKIVDGELFVGFEQYNPVVFLDDHF